MSENEDIVDELRHAAETDDDPSDATLYMRAADEIERLRAVIVSREITDRLPITAPVIIGEDGITYELIRPATMSSGGDN